MPEVALMNPDDDFDRLEITVRPGLGKAMENILDRLFCKWAQNAGFAPEQIAARKWTYAESPLAASLPMFDQLRRFNAATLESARIAAKRTEEPTDGN